MQVHAREVTGEERDRLWRVMVRTWPNYEKYAERTDRVIPVFALTPRGSCPDLGDVTRGYGHRTRGMSLVKCPQPG